MDVEIPLLIGEAAAELGDGVPYALKVLAGQLSEDPDMGEPSPLSGVLDVSIDGDTFEDCPALVVGYVHEPDRIEIRYVSRAQHETPAGNDRSQGQAQGPDEDQDRDTARAAVVGREVSDVWARIAAWLASHAPASYAALRAGVDEEVIDAFEGRLGVRIPAELRTLWGLIAGDEGVGRCGCLPDNMALMPLEEAEVFYRERMKNPVMHLDGEEVDWWKASWIPVISYGPDDRTSGLYLDTESGFLGRWSRYNDTHLEERDTLVTYLEETADMLEYPALAARDQPGLVGDRLVWGSGLFPTDEEAWRPLAG
ncbi:SMI1/KNR4 family protein [Streptomyces sp. NPDC006512]|uniref:SMI1/KNR4 family protein n=1 Tax=Streptomyces sp. NPDC006512 TaxID=3154307 RepID=UPI0033BB7E30